MVRLRAENCGATTDTMRHSLRFALAGLLLATAHMPAALAQTPKFISNFRDWTVYEVADPKGKICYIASEPSKQDGNYNKRGNPAVLVALNPAALKTNLADVRPGGTVIIDDGSFDERSLKKAGLATDPRPGGLQRLREAG